MSLGRGVSQDRGSKKKTEKRRASLLVNKEEERSCLDGCPECCLVLCCRRKNDNAKIEAKNNEADKLIEENERKLPPSTNGVIAKPGTSK